MLPEQHEPDTLDAGRPSPRSQAQANESTETNGDSDEGDIESDSSEVAEVEVSKRNTFYSRF